MSVAAGFEADEGAAPIPEVHMFGEKAPGSLVIPFGDDEDADELSGAYWFAQSDEDSDLLCLVGGCVRNGLPEDVAAMRVVVQAGPLVPRGQVHELELDFAKEIAVGLTRKVAMESGEHALATGPTDAEDEDEARDALLLVRVGDRTVDVIASLRHAFNKHKGARGKVSRSALHDVLCELDLDLAEDELAEAQQAFPEAGITFAQFRAWWIS